MVDPLEPPKAFAAASDQLHAAAAARAGSSDFGEPDYLLGLRILLLNPNLPNIALELAMGFGSLVSRRLANRPKRVAVT